MKRNRSLTAVATLTAALALASVTSAAATTISGTPTSTRSSIGSSTSSGATRALLAGVAAPAIVLSAGTASASTVYEYNDHTGGSQGFAVIGGNVEFIDAGNSGPIELDYIGSVDNGGNGSCWPFTCGNGFNNYFEGDAVYVWYDEGNTPCVTATASGSDWEADGTYASCANGHLYSYLVGAKAWDGKSGSLSFADVGATDAVDTGEYLNSASKGVHDNFSINCNTSCSYHA